MLSGCVLRPVGLEVDSRAPAAALFHRPCTMAGFLRKRRPAVVVVSLSDGLKRLSFCKPLSS